MFELVDAAFGGEEGVEVGLDALPGFGKPGGVRRRGGQRAQERGDQGVVRVETAGLAPAPADRTAPSAHRLWRRCGVVRREVGLGLGESLLSHVEDHSMCRLVGVSHESMAISSPNGGK